MIIETSRPNDEILEHSTSKTKVISVNKKTEVPPSVKSIKLKNTATTYKLIESEIKSSTKFDFIVDLTGMQDIPKSIKEIIVKYKDEIVVLVKKGVKL